MFVGRVIGGSAGDKIYLRLKSNSNVGIGDLLVVEEGDTKYYLKVVNLTLQSTIPSQHLEEIAGRTLESDSEIFLFDEKQRLYKIAIAKILKIRKEKFSPSRLVPNYFAKVKPISSEDFDFLKSYGEIPVGYLRLGTRYLQDVVISLPAEKLLRHHMLIVAATGKGKSNFAKVFLSGILSLNKYGVIVFDPHGEYFGSKGVKGLRDHVNRENIVYFTPGTLHKGSEQLKIYTRDLFPSDFYGIIDLSDAQRQAMDALYREYNEDWIKKLFSEPLSSLEEKTRSQQITLISLRRKLQFVLGLKDNLEGFVFSLKNNQEESLFKKIKTCIEQKKMVIIDTSLVGGESEKLISSAVVSRVYKYYRDIKQFKPDLFDVLPELLILFEEAPRVLGKDILSKGTNVFERIAREGRKFKVGICAITQIPSLLPREILSQMNTKIILGITSPQDREAVINSSSQVINDESIEIHMLDVGECIVTSPFIEFPLPVKVFKFEDILKRSSYEEDSIDISWGVG